MERRRVAIIAGNGDLASAYKVLNIATTAGAMGADVRVFFTFGGLQILHREANRDLPEPPGQEGMRERVTAGGAPGIPELLATALETGVKLIACQTTMDLMKIERSQLIDGIADYAGAATFLEFAMTADTTLAF